MEQEKKTVVLASDPFPPYQYFSDSGSLAGIDYSLVFEVTKRGGYEPKVILDEWGKVNDMLKAHEIDALFQIAPTPERLARCHFSDPYRNTVTEIITADPSIDVASYEDIVAKKLKVGMIRGYVYGDAFDHLPDDLKVPYPTGNDELLAVSRGEIALAVFDQGVRVYIAEPLGVNNVRSIDALQFERPMYVMFNSETLRDDFNKALSGYLAEKK